MEHRIVSLLPLSHLLEQAVGLFYALSVGADILYVRSRNPRVIFDALRDHRVTSMVVVPQVLDLFWSAIEREVEKRGRTTRSPAFARSPAACRCPSGRACSGSVHAQLGGPFRLFLSAGAFLPPALQQAWEDLGVTVLQGYGATETGTGSARASTTTGWARSGGRPRASRCGSPTTARSSSAARPSSRATGRTRDDRRGVHRGRLVPDRRHRPPRRRGPPHPVGPVKDMIVLPNGFNVYPEDIENALRIAGLRDSVVLETQPGRIEAVVLGSARRSRPGRGESTRAAPSSAAGSTPRSRPPTPRLGPNQRIAGWRLWPEADFPRTHTLKVKRDLVRAWVAADAPLPVA